MPLHSGHKRVAFTRLHPPQQVGIAGFRPFRFTCFHQPGSARLPLGLTADSKDCSQPLPGEADRAVKVAHGVADAFAPVVRQWLAVGIEQAHWFAAIGGRIESVVNQVGREAAPGSVPDRDGLRLGNPVYGMGCFVFMVRFLCSAVRF